MFKNDRLVVWEYVSNGLEYVEPGTSPVVRVRLDNRGKQITIQDNGRGMDWEGLSNFFVMHGENLDRRAGRPGRGRFGTGKSAAFGIGDVLRITTVHEGKRSQVELRRDDLESMAGGEPVAVRELEHEVPTAQDNGTLVEIEGVHLRSLDQAAVAGYIERHLAHWPRDVVVFVNNHQCEFAEPATERTEVLEPDAGERAKLGDAALTIKVSKSPLDEDLRGISIYSNGVWHETTLLASAGKDMSEFLFGEIDVPGLDTDKSTPPAFDASRSLKLNPDNPLVSAIYAFVGPHLERTRKQLVEEHRERRESEQGKRLRREASKIEEIINKDFEAFRKRLQRMRAAAAKAGLDSASSGPPQSTDAGGDDEFLFGGDEPATVVDETGEPGKSGNGGTAAGGPPRRLNPTVVSDPSGESGGHHETVSEAGKPRPRGGFQIEFDHQGAKSARAVYHADRRTIFVNLDHPQIAAAYIGRDIEDPVFRRLAYEVAFFEYAIALASELEKRDELADPTDAIFEIRDTMNRVALAAAPLYA